MTKTLVGSAALSHWIDVGRDPKDLDYFSDKEVPGAETFWDDRLASWKFGDVATLDELYTIKVSHSFWDLHGTWSKHMSDIVKMKNKGAVLIPELYDILYPIWSDLHGKKKANLEASPEEFFNSNVHRVYDHDSIHASVAYYDEPLFKSILRDDHEVAVSREKFESLDTMDKDRLVYEEAYATALERLVIPSGYTYSPKRAYSWAIKKTITSFSKGWFPLYIVDNYSRFVSPDVNYVNVHKSNSHRLLPFKEKM